MAGVGPGTTLAGRYALRTSVHRAPRGQRWRAHDQSTGQEVSVLVVPTGTPVAAAVEDAARRAAVLADPRLVRIVDVGQDQGFTFVVEDLDDDTPTLRDLLDDGPLAPEEARRIVGEVSMALERARQRGLHHQQLTPQHVSLADDGTVRVRGLGVDGALAGKDATDARAASREDTQTLSGVLYAALTATWPLAGTDLTPSPRVGRTLLAPSELSGGVPADLDHAATAALDPRSEDQLIPADVAELLGSWSDRPVRRVVEAGPQADAEPTPAEPAVAVEALPHELRGDVEHPPSKAAVAATAALGVAAAGSRSAAAKAKEAARVAAERRREAAVRRAADKAEVASLKAAEKAAERPFAQMAAEAPAPAEPVVPVIARDVVTSVPSRRQAGFVLGLMSLLVVGALVAACLGILDMVNTINSKVAMGPGPAVTRTVSASPVTVTAKPGGGVVAPAPRGDGAPVPIVGSTVFDPPPGDNSENSSMLTNITDGDPATRWQSSQYKSATFGGLKTGIGVVVDLGRKAPVRAAEVVVPQSGVGEDVTVYLTDTPPASVEDLAKLPVLGSATTTGTSTTITAAKDLGEHQYAVVWFTKAASAGNGYRASLAELKLTS